jgi:hypothetical protein
MRSDRDGVIGPCHAIHFDDYSLYARGMSNVEGEETALHANSRG